MSIRRLVLVSPFVIASLAALGCSTPSTCVPGETRDCTCAGGRPGAQVCAPDGQRYGVCDCGASGLDAGSDAAVTDVPATDAPAEPDVPPVTCATLPASLPAGWSRGALTQMSELPWIEIGGTFCNPFPNCGGTARILSGDAEYHAIRIDTPTDRDEWLSRAPSRVLRWDRSQVGGEADLVYIAIASCPGDFRIPPVDAAAPTGDPTFARGCRSTRRSGAIAEGMQSNINYVISEEPSTAETCHLALGRTYYINFIRANATDGSIGTPAEESVCVNPDLTTCGVQMRIE